MSILDTLPAAAPSARPAADLVTVTFTPAYGLEPLTTRAADVADNVARYFQRAFPGPLTVAIEDGRVLADGRLVATFTLTPLGGAA